MRQLACFKMTEATQSQLSGPSTASGRGTVAPVKNELGDYVIITPVRNEAAHLPETIASIASQEWRPRTWVIVDDGSTDGTGPICVEASRSYSWIRVVARPDRGFRKSGGGVVEAFNDG